MIRKDQRWGLALETSLVQILQLLLVAEGCKTKILNRLQARCTTCQGVSTTVGLIELWCTIQILMLAIYSLSLPHVSRSHLSFKLLKSLLMMRGPLRICQLRLLEWIRILKRVCIWLFLLTFLLVVWVLLILYQPALILQRVRWVYTACSLILTHTILIDHFNSFLPFSKRTLLLLLPRGPSVELTQLLLFLIDETLNSARDTADALDGVAFIHEGKMLWAPYP